jgi:hypothetical protein
MYSGHLTERAEEDDMDERIVPLTGGHLDAMGRAAHCKSICLEGCQIRCLRALHVMP